MIRAEQHAVYLHFSHFLAQQALAALVFGQAESGLGFVAVFDGDQARQIGLGHHGVSPFVGIMDLVPIDNVWVFTHHLRHIIKSTG